MQSVIIFDIFIRFRLFTFCLSDYVFLRAFHLYKRTIFLYCLLHKEH